MPEVTVTLVKYYKADGTSARGAWQRHDFKDADNQKYQTFEAALANRAYGLLEKPAVLTYEDVKRGDYTNRVIKDIQPVEVSQALAATNAAGGSSAPVSVAPVASDDVFNPQATPEYDGLAEVGLAQSKKLSENELRQIQIMRQSALERAIRVTGISRPADLSRDLSLKNIYALSEEFLHYFQTGEYPGKPSGEAALLAEFASQFPDAA